MSLEAKTQALAEAFADLFTEIAGGSGGGKAPAKSTGSKTSNSRSGKKAEITVDDAAEKFGDYLNKGSAAAKKKAKLVVKGIVAHFDAERITKMDLDDLPEAMKLLKAYQDGDDPLDLFEDDDDDDDDGMV